MWASATLALFLATRATLATRVEGYDLCIGPYALCAGAPCTAINSTNADCTCQGPFHGFNIGNTSTCLDRANALTSTFSEESIFVSPIQPKSYSYDCVGKNAGPFTECLDAPCSTKSGAIVCTCRLLTGNHTAGGQECPSTASGLAAECKKLRSYSTIGKSSGENSSGGGLSLFSDLYAHPPKGHPCKVPDS